MPKKLLITLILLTSYATIASALINPGDTLNPVTTNPIECPNGPTDPTCIVTLPSGGTVTADNGLTATGSNVQLGGTLLQNTTIDQDGHDFGFINGNVGVNTSNPQAKLNVIGTTLFVDGSTLNASGNPFITNFSTKGDITLDSIMPSFVGAAKDKYRFYGLSSSELMSGTYNSHAAVGIYNDSGDDVTNVGMFVSREGLQDEKGILIGDEIKLFDSRGNTNETTSINLRENGVHFRSFNNVTGQNNSINLNNNTGIVFSSELGGYIFPRTDGLANQVLTTDGAGQLSWQNAGGGGSGWSLTGNSGTTAGTNFIGTTDPQDFMVKTNGNQIALFGQNGNVSISSDNITFSLTPSIASGNNSFAIGAGNTASGELSFAAGAFSIASGIGSTAFGFETEATGIGSMAWGEKAKAQGVGSTAWGDSTASGQTSTAFGNHNEASGDSSVAFGTGMYTGSYSEISFGLNNTSYVPINPTSFNSSDRLFSIGNGDSSNHNAYTLWKDGSFAYNDDNFQNDTPGTEQNMFYFNYGNHDGLGGVNTKRAIRLGSALNDEWDINSSNVGDRSVAIGFGPYTSRASGDSSIAIGSRANAIGNYSNAFGTLARATGDYSFAFGDTNASGRFSVSFADSNGLLPGAGGAQSAYEFALGGETTSYIPNDSFNWDPSDRLFVIGKGVGGGNGQDAFTVLKNGQTGIGISQFQTNTNGNIFQVGDGTTGIIGYVDNGTGNWMAVSDERKKHNITDITYGLTEILKLKPVSFDYNRNNEHTIGFLAQQVLPIIPEAVGGDTEKGYSMSYATITPAIVKAIQELNLKVDTLQLVNGNTSTNVFDSLKNWLGDVGNGVEQLFSKKVITEQLCVQNSSGQTCINRDQLDQLLGNSSNNNLTNTSTPVTDTSSNLNNTTSTDMSSNSTDTTTPTPDTTPSTTSYPAGSNDTSVVDVPNTSLDSGPVIE